MLYVKEWGLESGKWEWGVESGEWGLWNQKWKVQSTVERRESGELSGESAE